MKKTLVALAALAASTAAFAQSAPASSVTLYGVIDASFTNVNKSAVGSFSGVTGSNVASSLWGLRGSENLGGGLRAVFNLEADLDPTNGTFDATASGINSGALFRRASWVGLAGGFGEITFGRRLNPMILNMIQNQILNSNSTTVVTAAAANAADFWVKNAITYTSPAMSGLTIQAQYAPSNIAGQDSNGTVTALAGRFVQGGLELHASMQDLSVAAGGNAAAGNTPATAAGKKSQLFGAKYTMGPLSFAATAFESKQNAPAPVAASLTKRDGYNVAVGYNFSKQLSTAVQYTEVNNSAGSSASMVSLQARYALSPRSAIYGMGNFVSQGTAAVAANAQTILPAWGSRGSAAGLAGADQQALSVGVIHRF